MPKTLTVIFSFNKTVTIIVGHARFAVALTVTLLVCAIFLKLLYSERSQTAKLT